MAMSAHCPTCGRKLEKPRTHMYWTRERVRRAMREWFYAHGRPPTMADWINSSFDHPNHSTVRARYGTWNAAIEEAGFVPLGAGGRR